MKLLGHPLVALVALVALSVGCASRPGAPASPEQETESTPHEVDQTLTEHDDAIAAGSIGSSADLSDGRRVGDYVTFAFSGAYREARLVLTQRVVARDDASITIDYTFAEAQKSQTLRVSFSTSAKTHGEIVEVATLGANGATKATTRAVFESKLAETAAMTDQNEALIDERSVIVRVGQADVPAKTSTYKVRIGQKSGTLETTASEAFAWGDLGGKITTADGKVFFKAELVDAGGPASATASLE